jgi:hypothetical protein
MGVPIGETIGAPISSAYENPMRRLIASTSPSDQSKRQYIHNGLFVNLFRIFGRRVESAGTGAGFGDPVFLSIEARIRVRAR